MRRCTWTKNGTGAARRNAMLSAMLRYRGPVGDLRLKALGNLHANIPAAITLVLRIETSHVTTPGCCSPTHTIDEDRRPVAPGSLKSGS